MPVKSSSLRLVLLLVRVLLPMTVHAQQPSSDISADNGVWTWSEKCINAQKLGVVIHFDHKTLYRGILPICRGDREKEDGRVEFHFSGSHLFRSEYHTRPNEMVECDIWEASGDSDSLVLGVSLATKKRILLNTLHVAQPDKRLSFELDKALFISTYPVAIR